MEGGEESWKGGFTAEREGLVGGGGYASSGCCHYQGYLNYILQTQI